MTKSTVPLDSLETMTSRPLETAKIIAISLIDPNPYQPRHQIQDSELADLKESILENGILQPLLVCPNGNRYNLIAGYRRLSAAKLAELVEVPCTVRDMTEDDMLKLALAENLQRTDLNPIEEAESVQKLMVNHGLTQEAVGKLINKSEGFISERLGLLKLPEEIRFRVAAGSLPLRKALEIGKLSKQAIQVRLADRAERFGLSDLHDLIQKKLEKEQVGRKKYEKRSMQADFREILNDLPGVRIYKDRVSFSFKSEEDLLEIIEHLLQELKGEQEHFNAAI